VTLNGTIDSDLHLCAVSADADDALVARVYAAPERPSRTAFQRDRERIVQARAFRRLAGKTQVFTSRASDLFRSRLTHTIEVMQIARSVAEALCLNQDLAETLALVHDIGHPPFGHAGERALDECLKRHGLRFDHNLHALRIVEHFEQRYAAHRGLNLTLGVREGIIKHSRDYSPDEHPDLSAYLLGRRPPLEAQIIDLADEIAYLTADLDDGMEAEILTLDKIRSGVTLFEQQYAALERTHTGAPEKLLAQESLKLMLNALADDLVAEVGRRVRAEGIATLADVRRVSERLVAFSPEMERLRREAKEFLYENLYQREELKRGHDRARRVIADLFLAWMTEPDLLPPSYAAQIAQEGAPRVIADYIAGMTDHFILETHRNVGMIFPGEE
jgi:dGTPase